MLEETLSKLGFSPSEVKIYLYLLKGSSYPNKISSETKLNRTNVYEALDRLVTKGMVSFIQRNKIKWFEAKPLESVAKIVTEKEEDLQKLKTKLQQDMKVFKKSAFSEHTKLEASVFVGKKGLKMLFEEILEVAQPISLMAAEWQFKDFFGPYFELWHKKRIEKRIHQRTIFPAKLRSKLIKRKFLEYKFVDNTYINPTSTLIFGNTCLLIEWSEEPIAIKIDNKDISKSHLNYFNLLWKVANQ